MTTKHDQACPIYNGRECDCNYTEPPAPGQVVPTSMGVELTDEIMALVEDYAGARVETALFNARVDTTGPKRMAKPRLEAVRKAVTALFAPPDGGGRGLTDAAEKLLAESEAYLRCAREHSEASFFDDEEEMDEANRAAERVYESLRAAQDEVRAAIDRARGGVL